MKAFNIALAVTLALSSITTTMADSKARKACQARVQADIDRVNARMRQRYGAREGEALRAKLRQLEDQYYACRKAR